ncbi:DUF3526 domain-containing protein [Chitinophaga japonensis]|uniref:ABC-2 type transport system permease protein n=1 Tax=Chitinophaga japonensis TaxID=104662 RepID=A0A562SSE3_CHIJA|nr:DUF3526 domain-containing protein [Chitinophaga japonensis]TWI84189.1 ABC-2 type transport system permease protein [Chitinophaga japonensis]
MNRLYSNISVIKRILQMEVHMLQRTALLPALLGILFLSGAAALLYGRHVMVAHKATLDSIHQDYQLRYDELYGQLQADTSTPKGKTAYISATHPAVVDYRLHRTVYHPPAPLSLMAIGVSDMATWYYPVSVRGGYVPAEEKVSNPEHLQTGNFDGAFLLVYLLPLMAICLSYNLLSQEKEQGTLSLFVVQKGNITGALLLRLLLRYLMLMAAIVLISLAGVLLAVPQQGFPWRDFLAWTGVAAAYMALWMGIIWFILSWNASAAVNIIAMLGAWLLLLVVIPAATRLTTDSRYADDTAGNASLQRSIKWETWDLPQKHLLDSFYAVYPQYFNARAYDTGTTNLRHAMAYYELVERRMERVLSRQDTERRRNMQAVAASWRYNPAVYTQALLNGIARTDVADYAWFHNRVASFHYGWKQFFYNMHFNDLQFTAADYKAMPVYHPAYDPAGPARWMQGILYLLLQAAAWLLAGILVLLLHTNPYT